jgi:hypothetical protein
MPESIDYGHLIDPEYRRWGRKYPRFPGVAECVRLLQTRNVRGAWVDIIAYELSAHEETDLAELIEVFRTDASESTRRMALVAVAEARLPSAAPFLATVAREREPSLAPIAERGLSAIASVESKGT